MENLVHSRYETEDWMPGIHWVNHLPGEVNSPVYFLKRHTEKNFNKLQKYIPFWSILQITTNSTVLQLSLALVACT